MLTTEMSFKRSVTTKNGKLTSRKRKSGTSLYRSLEGLRFSTKGKFCIEIWRVRTFSSIGICRPNLEILTFLKLSKRVSVILKLALPIMPVQKCGETCLTMVKVISGPLGAFSTKCVHLCHHSERTTCKAYIRKSLRASTPAFLNTSLKKWQVWLSSCYKFPQVTDQHVIRFCLSTSSNH